jgi:hypothetical protein
MSTPDMPPDIKAQIELDADIYGNGFAEFRDGEWRRIDPTNVVIAMAKSREEKYGEPLLTPKVIKEVAKMALVKEAGDEVARRYLFPVPRAEEGDDE